MTRPVRWYWALATSCVVFLLVVSLTNHLVWGPALEPYGLLGGWTIPFTEQCNSLLGDDYGWLVAGTVTDLPGFVAGVLIWAWLRRRAASDGFLHCLKCGYILKGLAEPRCPECGEAI